MDSEITVRRLFRESLPVGGILFFWTAFSWLGAESTVATAFRVIGVVIAAAYVVTRGVSVGRSHSPVAFDEGVKSLVGGNLRVAAAAGVWLLFALGVSVVGSSDVVGASGFGSAPTDGLVFAAAATAVGTAGIYAVTAGFSMMGEPRRASGGHETADD